jgi:hypothetical protein
VEPVDRGTGQVGGVVLDAGLLARAPFRYVDKTMMTPAGPR